MTTKNRTLLRSADALAKSVDALAIISFLPKEKRMGHAGAIVEGGEGDAASKIERLRAFGIPTATRPSEIPALVKELF